jgi:hypothetical protein
VQPGLYNKTLSQKQINCFVYGSPHVVFEFSALTVHLVACFIFMK